MPSSFDFTVVLEPQAEGGFTVSVPALPEVVTEGDTEAEATDGGRRHSRDFGLPPRPRHSESGDAQPTVRKITIAACTHLRLP